ncbi:MAG: hypothetical protein J3Q66DRAFT_441047 [Benniella sp.]|nr:MAG: hypothetical protein J3Q66DRAFT_441047 [Benniella sp.]
MSSHNPDASLSSEAQEVKVPLNPLSLFFLPPDLVSTLVPMTQIETDASDSLLKTTTTHNPRTAPEAVPVATSLDTAVPSCRVCGITRFDSVLKQREHAKLDWHRYNLKQHLLDRNANPLSEHDFENMVQDLSSISGSDDDDVDHHDDSDHEQKSGHTTPNTRSKRAAAAAAAATGTKEDGQEALIQSLMKNLELTIKENQKTRNQDPVLIHQQQILEQQLQEARMSPMIWFTAPMYGETVRLGVYKNALPNKGLCEDIPQYLQSLQFPVVPVVKKQKNNKARRAARRAAAELEAANAGEQPSPDSTQLAEAQDDAEVTSAVEPSNEAEQEAEAEAENAEEDEEEEEEVYEPDWLKYQKQPKLSQATTVPSTHQARYWTLILLGGGHFAGVVMDLAGQVSHHGRDIKMVAHKTFHRYTVRRKQGGSQASHGIANSAGARIRMYNEEALKLEVRELLDGWSHWIKQSECVYVHAPGNNRRVLFYDNSVISAAERQGRLRSIPFMTRRPTLSELKRAYQELTTVKVSVLTKEALDRVAMEEQEAMERVLRAKSTKENEASKKALQQQQQAESIAEASPEVSKLVELVKKGRAEAVSNHLLKHGMDASQPLPLTSSSEYDIRRTPTILHLASHHGQAPVVKILLEKHNADPTVTTASALNQQQQEGEDGEDAAQQGAGSFTAYDIAKDKETRNAFRRAMALLPDSWDWIGGAHVPSALTPEMEAEQERKAKEKTRKLLDAERERKKTREANRPVTAAPAEPPTTLTGSSSSQSVMSKNMAAVSAANSHLSPEMRMRLERERRAAAAEARMAAQQQVESIRRAVQQGQNVCVACGKNLDALTPFEKFGRKFCTTDCVAKGPA